MKANDFATFCIEHGDKIRVQIANPFGFDVKQRKTLKEKGCFFLNNEDGVWFFDANNVDDYKKMCRSLRGFQMENFTYLK